MKKNLFSELNFRQQGKMSGYMYAYYHCRINPNVALIESRMGEDLAGNMLRIVQGLKKRKLKIFISVKKKYEEKIRGILKATNLQDVYLVTTYSYHYGYLLATAKYLFNDVVFDIKYIKREGQIYVNTWHGTPLKHLGYDVSGEEYIMGNMQRNLLMADYIVAPNRYCAEHLLSAFHLNHIFHGKILYSGYPRNQVFFDKEYREIIRENLGISGKKVYVYMPTWRGKHSKTSSDFTKVMLSAFEYLDANFTDDQILYVKLHNMMYTTLDLSGFSHIKPFPQAYETYDMLNCADCLITDYSSVFFDFANTRKKIILFVPDKEAYFRERGGYMSIDELPFPQVMNSSELLDAINYELYQDYSEFVEEYCTYDRADCTDALLAHVIDGEKICHEETLCSNGKKNVVLYLSNPMLKNGLTTSLNNLLTHIDRSKCNYYFAFYRVLTNGPCEFFNTLPDDVSIFSVSSGLHFTLGEKIAYYLYRYKKWNTKWVQNKLDRLYRREIKKIFYDSPFDVLIHFEGYGSYDTIPTFQRYPGKKIIYVHNDMIQEARTRHNQDLRVLKEAYRNYDSVAVVSQDLIKPTVEISQFSKNISVVNNVHDADGIRLRALSPIFFEANTECRTFHPGGVEGVLCSTGKKFITVGRFSPEKGHERLLKAFDRFCRDYPDSQLIIIGGHGPLYNKTLSQISKMEFWKNVTVIKSISNPMPIIKRCDLFILSSKYEGLGLVLLEADCLGVPSFSTDITGPRRLYQGFGGTLVENSEDGILSGMYAYVDGKVSTLNLDYIAYNRRAVSEFESLFMEEKMQNTITPAFKEKNVPIVFSSNDAFVPVMATMIQSIIENASPDRYYDILILTQDISVGYERKLQSMVASLPNFSLRVINVGAFFKGYDLYTANRKDITVETFFRLVLPDLLPDYDKVLYLDGDMVANADVAELYDEDVRDYLLASSPDPDSIGRCHKPGGDPVKDYRENVLKMKDLDNFFCAGMLVMNLDRFRKELPTKQLMEVAASYPWKWHDQDVLNMLCEGKTKMVHMAWDVLRNAGNNRYMPKEMYAEYLEAERNPKIIHYGGMRKPWLYLDVERGEYFWRYAGRTPFYQEILAKVNQKKAREIMEEDIKDAALVEFGKGHIGPRYILKYCIAWIRFKIKK